MEEVRHIVFFDGKCNFCNSTVNLLFSKNRKRNLFYSSLQSEFAKDFLPFTVDDENLGTIYYFSNGVLYSKSTAVLMVLKELTLWYSILMVFLIVPSILRDMVYNLIARNRHRISGKRDTCRVPSSEEKQFFLETKEDLEITPVVPWEEQGANNFPRIGFTIALLGFFILPYTLYIRYGDRMEPYPAVILPSGAGLSFKNNDSLSYEYPLLFGYTNDGGVKYLNPEEFLYPMPSYYIGHIVERVNWIADKPEEEEISGKLFSLMKDRNIMRDEFRINELPEFKVWLSKKLNHVGCEGDSIRIDYHRVIQSFTTGIKKKDIIYAQKNICLK